MTKLRRSAALFVIFALLAPSFAGAVEFKEGAVPEIPKMVPIAPGLVGVTILPTATVPTLNQTAEIPTAGLTAVPKVQPGAEAKLDAVTPIVAGVTPQLETIAKPETGTEASAGASANVTTVLQGGKPTEAGGSTAVAAVNAGSTGAGAPALEKNDGAKPSAPAAPAAPVTKKPEAKQITTLLGYKVRRAALAAIATHWGIVYSMPSASPALSEKILSQEARNADVIYSDIDDTLTKFNTKLPRAQAENIEGVLAVGKTFAAITDRPDKVKPGSSSMSALETMSTLHEDKRAGLIVATNGGGKIYEYDQKGEPQLIYEEPSLPETERPLINEAAEVVKSQLAANGTAIFEKSPGGPSPYGHTLIFIGGTPEATVKHLAHVFETELRSRGLGYQVEGRMAKDPSLPPYITFSKLNKSLAVERIMEVKKLQDKTALGMGDSMYAPVKPTDLTGWKARTAPWALKLGAIISGSEIPLTGNRTDANMEHGNPGMTMLSVGTTGDPRMKNGYVLAGKGPDVAARILIEAARKPSRVRVTHALDGIQAVLVLALLGIIAAGIVYVFSHAAANWVNEAERQLHQDMREATKQWPF